MFRARGHRKPRERQSASVRAPRPVQIPRTVDITPAIGIRLSDNLSIGASAIIQQVDIKLRNALPNASPLQPDGQLNVAGDDLSFGWDVGILAKAGAAVELDAVLEPEQVAPDGAVVAPEQAAMVAAQVCQDLGVQEPDAIEFHFLQIHWSQGQARLA